jgi:hypothetical protein
LDRRNAIHAALWPDALAGNVKAVMALLPIMNARCRLFGLHDLKPDRRRGALQELGQLRQPPTVMDRKDDCRRTGCDWHGKF